MLCNVAEQYVYFLIAELIVVMNLTQRHASGELIDKL